MSGSGGEPCASGAGAARSSGRAKEVLFPGCGGPYVYGVGYETLVKGDSVITDGGNKEIPNKRRFCFLTDGVEGFGDIIPDGEVGKASRGAGDGRIESLTPKIPRGAVYADRRDARDGFGELKGMRAFERGWGRGGYSPEIIIKGICRIYVYGA